MAALAPLEKPVRSSPARTGPSVSNLSVTEIVEPAAGARATGAACDSRRYAS